MTLRDGMWREVGGGFRMVLRLMMTVQNPKKS